MTYEEADEYLAKLMGCASKTGEDCLCKEDCNECEYDYESDDWEDAIATAKEALEKQMPKKPKKLTYEILIKGGWTYECPSCGLAVGENAFTDYEYIEPIEPFCGQCGQRIDWSEVE